MSLRRYQLESMDEKNLSVPLHRCWMEIDWYKNMKQTKSRCVVASLAVGEFGHKEFVDVSLRRCWLNND